MYSWGTDTSNWRKAGKYKFGLGARAEKKVAGASGPRTYAKKEGPDEQYTDPKKRIRSASRNPLVVAVDVTGSMREWPFEIFDRLPLLYQTLAQYRDDLDIAFMAVGDAEADQWPLQVTNFGAGFDLERKLGAIYGEGGGNQDPAESYGLVAHYLNERVQIPEETDGKPFLVVFGDVTMQPRISRRMLQEVLGLAVQSDVDALEAWRKVAETWDTWFLSRPGRLPEEEVDAQWSSVLGADHIVHIHDEKRAVDYAMGLIARTWGRLDDFTENLRARQDERTVDAVIARL